LDAGLAAPVVPGTASVGDDETEAGADASPARRRRRGSRGGRGRRSSPGSLAPALDNGGLGDEGPVVTGPGDEAAGGPLSLPGVKATGALVGGLPGVPPAEAPGVGEAAVFSRAGTSSDKPKIGDTRPGSPPAPRRRVGRAVPAASAQDGLTEVPEVADVGDGPGDAGEGPSRSRRNRRRRPGGPDAARATVTVAPVQGGLPLPPISGAGPVGKGSSVAQVGPVTRAALDDFDTRTSGRRGDRRPKPVGRYLMVVHMGPTATQIAVLEGRTLIEHYVSRPADDATQIDGNIYLGRVQNVLPGMEAAFVDIGTPKNAVLYRGDLRYDDDEVGPAADDASKPTRGRLGGAARDARIEQLLRTGQNIICQVTKNPIGTKGARLTQEVSLPGRFVVLIPDSDTYGISKRLADDERKRLRKILDEVRPAGHGLIVRTAAEGASADELTRDVNRLLRQWEQVQQLARSSRAPQLLYREPDLAVRVIREEFNRDYRGVVIDDRRLYEQVREYVESITPELADRVELVDPSTEALPLFERFRVHEQVHKALDRKVWLPSGGSLIIERTEALTVIDVNTGKNVGTSNLEETVYRNNLEAAEEIARQLRLRDIGGIIVIDFIDMEVAANRQEVIKTFREALARDKTRSQVFDISELGLVEMTRKRISEGLVESYSETCPTCAGRGIVFDESLL
jgi:ribonuclease E